MLKCFPFFRIRSEDSLRQFDKNKTETIEKLYLNRFRHPAVNSNQN